MKKSDFLVSAHDPVGQVQRNFYGWVSFIQPTKIEVYKRNFDTTLTLMAVTWCYYFLHFTLHR